MSRFHRKMRPNMCYYININTLPVLLAQGRVMTETETKNGNGIIDEKEFKWYLPASNQLLGLCVAALPDLEVEARQQSIYHYHPIIIIIS